MLSRSSSLLRVTASRLTAARLVRSSARAMSTNAPKAGLWARYNELLDTAPLATKAVTSAAICGAGDAACQLFVEKKEEFNVKRLGIMTFLGFSLVAPATHYWCALHRPPVRHFSADRPSFDRSTVVI